MHKEYIEKYTSDGKPTGKKFLKSEIHRKGIIHSTIHLWIFCNKNKILIQKRSKSKEINPGIWDVSVAGHIKYGENFINAVIRESKEETGIKIQKEKLKKVGVFYTEEFYTNVTDREFHHTYIYKISSDEIDLDFNNNEVEELQFISLNNMKDLLQNNSEFFIGSNKSYYNSVIAEIESSI